MGSRVAGRILAVFLAAGVCAAIANLIAGPERKLAWIRRGDADARVNPSVTPASTGSAAVSAASATLAGAAAPAAATGSAPAPHPDKPYVEISGDEVKRLFDKGTAFFDARRSNVYRVGHIAGARSFPVWEADIDDRVKAFYAEGVEPSTPLVVYCDGGECEDSHTLAQKLYLAGFDNAMVYKDGFPDWSRHGWPVKTGDKP